MLALLAIDEQGSDRPPVAVARARFRHVLSALRLFERGGYAIGPVGWARTEAGTWRSVSIGVAGRPRLLTIVPAAQEDELRAFCRLVARRDPQPELAWALGRYEMGCERQSPGRGADGLPAGAAGAVGARGPRQRAPGPAARGHLRPARGPGGADRADGSSRGAGALGDRRPARASAADPARPDAIIDELAENLRAVLRDMLCGHLDADLVSVADELLAEAADAPAADSSDPAAGVR